MPVELPDDLRDQLRSAADEIGEPVSTLMRLAIRAGLPEARRVLLDLKNSSKPTTYPPHRPQNHILNDPEPPKP